MKIACVGDIHAHMFKEFDEHTDFTGSKRLDNIVYTMDKIARYCLENAIKYVLIPGDMFHTRGKINTVVFNAMYRTMEIFSHNELTTLIIPGNHDDVDNSDVPEHALEAFRRIPNVYVYGEATVHVLDNEVSVLCIPFSKNADFIKSGIDSFVEGVKNMEGTYPCILMTHVGVSGAMTGVDSYIMQDAFMPEDLHPEYFKYVVLGHYHKRQIISGYPNMFYTGTPIQNSFNDEGEEKGFYIIDTDKRWDVQFVPVDNPMFVTVNFSVTDEQLQVYCDHKDYVRVQLKEDEVQSFQSRVPQGLQYRIELQKEYKQELRSEVEIGMSFEDIVKTYARENMPEAEEIGLKILEEVQNK